MKLNNFFFTVLFLLIGLQTQAKHRVEDCRRLETAAIQQMQQMNLLFGMNVELEFISHERVPRGEAPQPLTLMSANSATKTLQLPRPCLMTEVKLPSIELWSYLIAHEYSHKILDQKQDQCFREFFKSQGRLTPEQIRERDLMHHVNNDVLALKILAELKVDGFKSINDLNSYSENEGTSSLGPELKFNYLKRVKYLKQIWPTDFSSAKGFLFAQYFDGLHQMQRVVTKKYPNSSLIREIRDSTHESNGCFVVKGQKVQQSLAAWAKLSASFREPMPRAKPTPKKVMGGF